MESTIWPEHTGEKGDCAGHRCSKNNGDFRNPCVGYVEGELLSQVLRQECLAGPSLSVSTVKNPFERGSTGDSMKPLIDLVMGQAMGSSAKATKVTGDSEIRELDEIKTRYQLGIFRGLRGSSPDR